MTAHKDFDKIENNQFVLTGRLSAKEYFAEGLTQMFFGVPLTKVLLHTIIEPKDGDNPEIRKAQQYLTMPTVMAIELAHIILSTAKNSEERLMNDLDKDDQERVKELLKNFQLSDSVKSYLSEEIKASPKKRKLAESKK